MPPEQSLSWDRKDLFKERKHERSESLGSSVSRWRDSSSSSVARSRDFARWGSADLRRPHPPLHPGHAKLPGWHMFSEDLGRGYAPSRSNHNLFDQDKYSFSSISGDGKYARSSRENRGSTYTPKDWKSQSRESSNGSRIPTIGRPGHANNIPTYISDHPHSKNHFKGHHVMGVNGPGANQSYEQENTLGSDNWKPLKWTRSGSISTRGSGYSRSTSPKSVGLISGEAKAQLQPISPMPTLPPFVDAVTSFSSNPQFEEMSCCKKQRLGWGEGLAKYEKKKVDSPDDGPDEGPNRNEITSPRVSYISDWPSPATPSSVACSSSPGMENTPYVKGSNTDNDTSNLLVSSGSGFQNYLEELSLNLKGLKINAIASMGSYIIELLQFDDQTADDSNFVRSTAMNKLLMCKSDISKALEMTECEIDALENELKSLKSIPGNTCSFPAMSTSMLLEGIGKPCEEKAMASSMLPMLPPLQLESARDMMAEKTLFPTGAVVCVPPEHKGESKDEFDSPGTATSKLVEQSAMAKGTLSSNFVKPPKCPGVLDGSRFTGGGHNVNSEITDCFDSKNSKFIVSTYIAPVSSNLSLFSDGHDASLCDSIFASNRETAHIASKVFNKLLKVGKYQSDNLEVANVTSCQKDLIMKGNIARRKQFLRFKERVLTLKFKAFQYLWKEDKRLLSAKKINAKFQKRLELSSRVSYSGFQKHRSSVRSRLSSPVKNLSLVPTSEMINFTSKLLFDSQFKRCRKFWKMPALILDKKELLVTKYLFSNRLVEDPLAVEKERTMINPWTSEEKKVFMDNLAVFGKDFRKIASFLDHKTTADCVEFYYKNHKSDSFEKTKKPTEISKHGKPLTANTYMLTLGKKWNRELNVASLDILGAASVIAAQADVDEGIRYNCCGSFSSGSYSEDKTHQGENGLLEGPNNVDAMENERETVAAADVLAGICGSLSSEAMSSCITSSLDPPEGYPGWKYKKEGSARKRPLTPEVTQIFDDETCSDESSGELDSSDWTDGEKSVFIQAFSSYGRDFATISQCVRTRSREQCKVFFSKAQKCLGLDMIQPGPGNLGASATDDANRGGNDGDDACVVEKGSDICSSKSDSMFFSNNPVQKGSAVQFEKNLMEDVSLSTIGLEEIRKTNYQNSISVDGQGHSYIESQILKGSPLPTMKKVINVNNIGLKTAADPILQLYTAQECVVKKCSTSNSQSSLNELNHHDHPRSHSRSSSDPEKPSKDGDFKLFGQILCNPSPAVTHENNGKATHHTKMSNNSINLKFSMHHSMEGSKFDRNNYLDPENFSMKTYGFWDGNRIQTGFSAVPESGILRAKYSSAFCDYPPVSSSIIEKSPLQTILKKNGNNFNGVPMLPTRETDYQMYRSRDGNKFQQLIHQQRQDLAYEKQMLKGFGGVSGLQQQGRGVVIGSAGILASPPVSDPVAAFKMHYAKAEQYGTQAEEGHWRGI